LPVFGGVGDAAEVSTSDDMPMIVKENEVE
jgi:hypothetical protein